MKTEEKKVVTIAEDNRFHKARKKIAEISRQQNKDVGVAAVIWAHANAQSGYEAELKEFLAYVAHKQKQTTKADNLVAEYFGAEVRV